MTPPKNPAPYSDSVLDAIASLDVWDERYVWNVLDPFAGIGRIHELPELVLEHHPEVELRTVGIEIEPEWANQHPKTRVGDSTKLPRSMTERLQAVVTSCTYGNRMADKHNAQERCKPCAGSGRVGNKKCEKCHGKGKREYKRITYTHYLGRKLHENNTGGYQWTQRPYRELHEKVWAEVWRVLEPGGIFVLNISNHIRGKVVQDVVQWHLDACEALGFVLEGKVPVDTPRMRFGQNHDARVEHEVLLVLRKPE